MKHEDGKPIYEKNSRVVPMTVLPVVLCAFSFYLGKVYCPEKDRIVANVIGKVVGSSKAVVPLQVKSVSFPKCGIDYQDYTPCTDPNRWRKYDVHRLTFMERHCPPLFERKECLVPPPDGYKVPIKWPTSKNKCWYRNVPYDWIISWAENSTYSIRACQECVVGEDGQILEEISKTTEINFDSHGPNWLVGRSGRTRKTRKNLTQSRKSADLAKVREEIAAEMEQKMNQKLKVILEKLAEKNPSLEIDVDELCATTQNEQQSDGDGDNNGNTDASMHDEDLDD